MELEKKILEIINEVEELYGIKRYELPHKRFEIMAKQITALYNKELAFEIACNPDVMEAETNNKIYQEQIDKRDKLIEAQDELIIFYGNIIENSAMFLHVHHWEESTENIEKGRNLRDTIEQLKKELK